MAVVLVRPLSQSNACCAARVRCGPIQSSKPELLAGSITPFPRSGLLGLHLGHGVVFRALAAGHLRRLTCVSGNRLGFQSRETRCVWVGQMGRTHFHGLDVALLEDLLDNLVLVLRVEFRCQCGLGSGVVSALSAVPDSTGQQVLPSLTSPASQSHRIAKGLVHQPPTVNGVGTTSLGRAQLERGEKERDKSLLVRQVDLKSGNEMGKGNGLVVEPLLVRGSIINKDEEVVQFALEVHLGLRGLALCHFASGVRVPKPQALRWNKRG